MTTAQNTYNGWSNYPTWRVNIEIIDDYTSSLEEGEVQFDALHQFADHLQEYAEEVVSDYGQIEETTAYSYALAFLGMVNWHEIAATAAEDMPWLIASDNES